MIFSVAVLKPLLVGTNITENVAADPGAIGEAGLRAVTLKEVASGPLMVMLLTDRLLMPVFWIVKVDTTRLLVVIVPKSVPSVTVGVAVPLGIFIAWCVTLISGAVKAVQEEPVITAPGDTQFEAFPTSEKAESVPLKALLLASLKVTTVLAPEAIP